jgi:hypothetical protein
MTVDSAPSGWLSTSTPAKFHASALMEWLSSNHRLRRNSESTIGTGERNDPILDTCLRRRLLQRNGSPGDRAKGLLEKGL